MNDISQLVNATVLVEICSVFIFLYLIKKFCWPLIINSLDERAKILKEGIETAALVKEKLKEAEEFFNKRIDDANKIILEKDRLAELTRQKIFKEEQHKLKISFDELKAKTDLEIQLAIKKAKEDIVIDISDLIVETLEVFLSKNGWELSEIDNQQIEDALRVVSKRKN